jgi:protein-S-isoprenylcysteine O-methyltransferase Ste14
VGLCYNTLMDYREIKHLEKESVHWVLTHSYVMYLIFLLIGISLDLVFKLRLFHDFVSVPIGAVVLLLGTVVIIWTERTGRRFNRENVSKENFAHGPYSYTRSPVHLGLSLLLLGLGLILNAFFVVLTTLTSFMIGKFIFQSREERALEKKYGIHYTEYKKSVRF